METQAQTTSAKSKRKQLTDELGIEISPARVRTYLDRINVNGKIEHNIRALKLEKLPYDTAKRLKQHGKKVYDVVDTKQRKFHYEPATEQELADAEVVIKKYEASSRSYDIDKELEALTKERIRFSSEAPNVLSIILNELIKQLLKFAMDQVLVSDEKKIIKVVHMHRPGVEKLSLYPLVANLPSWLDYTSYTVVKNPEKKFVDGESSKKTTKEGKEATTTGKEAATTGKEAATTSKEAATQKVKKPHKPKVLSEEYDKTSFKHYVNLTCAKLIQSDTCYCQIVDEKNDTISKIKISTPIREYCSNLIIELINRLSSLIQLTIDAMDIKTVGKTAIIKTVQLLLVDGKKLSEELVYSTEMISPKKDPKSKEVKEPVPTLVVHKKMIWSGLDFDSLVEMIETKLKILKITYPKKDHADKHVEEDESAEENESEHEVDELTKGAAPVEVAPVEVAPVVIQRPADTLTSTNVGRKGRKVIGK